MAHARQENIRIIPFSTRGDDEEGYYDDKGFFVFKVSQSVCNIAMAIGLYLCSQYSDLVSYLPSRLPTSILHRRSATAAPPSPGPRAASRATRRGFRTRAMRRWGRKDWRRMRRCCVR